MIAPLSQKRKPTVAVLLNHYSAGAVMSRVTWSRLRSLARVQFEPAAEITPGVLERVLRDSDAVITSWRTPQLDQAALDLAPNLRLIAHAAGSVRPVTSDAVWARNITVTSAASSIALSVSEFTLGALIFARRRVLPNIVHVRAGRWGTELEGSRMKSLHGAKVGVVGAGFVGRNVIETLQRFGAQVAVYDPLLNPAEAIKLKVQKMPLKRLARWCEVLSLHAPDIPDTRRMISKEIIAALQPGATLINTARGGLVDETALIARLKVGDLTAILDVTDPEPPAVDSPLRQLPNVLLTPHIAGAGTFDRLGEFAVEEVERMLQRKKPLYAVTREMLAKMA